MYKVFTTLIKWLTLVILEQNQTVIYKNNIINKSSPLLIIICYKSFIKNSV